MLKTKRAARDEIQPPGTPPPQESPKKSRPDARPNACRPTPPASSLQPAASNYAAVDRRVQLAAEAGKSAAAGQFAITQPERPRIWRSAASSRRGGETSLFRRQASQCHQAAVVIESFAELLEVDGRDQLAVRA